MACGKKASMDFKIPRSPSPSSSDDIAASAEDRASEATQPCAYERVRDQTVARNKAALARLLSGVKLLPDGNPEDLAKIRPPRPPIVRTTDSSPTVTRSRARKGQPKRMREHQEDSDFDFDDNPSEGGAEDDSLKQQACTRRPTSTSPKQYARQKHHTTQQQTPQQPWQGPPPWWNYANPWQQAAGGPGQPPSPWVYGGQGQPPPNMFYGPPAPGTSGSQPPWAGAWNPPSTQPPVVQDAQQKDIDTPGQGVQDVFDQDPLAHRRKRRAEKKAFEREVEARNKLGFKPYLIEVNSEGEVIEDGRHQWFSDLRRHCQTFLDLGVIDYSKQPPAGLVNMRRQLDSRYEYSGCPLSETFLKKRIQSVLKTERDRLKKQWEGKLGSREDAPCPPGIKEHHWKALISYWTSPEGKAVSCKMRDARSQVVNVNHSGRTGYAGSAKKLKTEGGESPFHQSISDQVFTPRFGGSVSGQSSKMSGSVLNTRFELVEKSCAQSQSTMDALQSNFTKLEDKVDNQASMLQQLIQMVQAIVPQGAPTNMPTATLNTGQENSKELEPAEEDEVPDNVKPARRTPIPQDPSSKAVPRSAAKKTKRDIFPVAVKSTTQSVTRSASLSLSLSMDQQPGAGGEIASAEISKEAKVAVIRAARELKGKQFRVGDYVILKKPKAALIEGALARVVAVPGQIAHVGRKDSNSEYEVENGFVGVEILIIIDGTVPLCEDIIEYPEKNTLAEVKGFVILWNDRHMKRARQQDLDMLGVSNAL